MADAYVAPPICGPGGGGMIFPIGGDFERSWPWPIRGLLYAAAMVYWFYGIAIVADIFMGSIEKVTSRRVRKLVDGGRAGYRTVRVWNETVATLTLMALGSSAPEIFLSIIDTWKKSFHFGNLGPATIVGSAAFNLLVIIAVCIVVIPSAEVRVISNLPAFYITALFSLVAYLWMAFIILGTSPDVVDLWEAAVTLLLLPVLVYVSYKVDIGAADGCLRRLGVLAEAEEKESSTEAGFFSFDSQDLKVEGSPDGQVLELVVHRHGCNDDLHLGEASCRFRTEAMSAVEGCDFEAAEGSLTFAEGETRQVIKLTLLPKAWRAHERDFLVILEDAEGGPSFCPHEDGGDDHTIVTVILGTHGPRPEGLEAQIDAVFGVDALRRGAEDWREQFRSCLYCGGSPEDQAEATPKDWAIHIITVPWNALFAFCPPTSLVGGWACFIGSLLGIALLTACVSDLAELFGCVLSVPDIITAITFVALGTSMPDLFASISAAKDDPTADASIVNVTGSNSVNVFLGLGIPWTLAALFWKFNGRTPEWEGRYPKIAGQISGAAFVVEAGELAFSVISFCVVCVLALALLHLRRRWLGAELGGPPTPKLAASGTFVFLWCGWVAVVSGQVLRWGKSSTSTGEAAAVYCTALVLAGGASAATAALMRQCAQEDGQAGAHRDLDGKPPASVGAGNGAAPQKVGHTDTTPSTCGRAAFDFVGVGGTVSTPSRNRGSCPGMSCRYLSKVLLGTG